MKKFLVSLCILILVSLACESGWGSSPSRDSSPMGQTIEADIDEEMGLLVEQPQPTKESRPPTPTPIAIEDSPQLGGCYWRNYEISPPADSTSDPKMTVDTTSTKNEISTTFTHGVSGCPEQYFTTFHYWDFDLILKPGENERFSINLEWINIGTTDCSTLIAGAVTRLELDGNSYVAGNDSINVKTEPTGSIENITTWTVPEGSPGDTFTITIRATTGSYGGVVRYRFEYVCE